MAAETDIKTVVSSLSSVERAVLPFLKNNISFDDVVRGSKLKNIEVMRALQWLENKGALKINTSVKEIITLDSNGNEYLKRGLPERRFLKALSEKQVPVKEVQKKAGITDEEVSICLGVLKGKAAINISKGVSGPVVSITENGKKIASKESLEEIFLSKKFPIDISKLSSEDKFAFENLKKRKMIVKTEVIKERIIMLTTLGERLSKERVSADLVEALTPEMIKEGSWKNKEFRRYDIRINVPSIGRSKRHFVNQTISYIKRIWLDMGFREMEGNIVQTSFWDLDALFVPQDHPARAMQDTFYLKDFEKNRVLIGNLPAKLKEKIKKVHESGADTGSLGWNCAWDENTAREVLIRTHTTVLSAQAISNLKEDQLPAKFFSVNKVFRNEALDSSHLFEFYQVEGIVVDENANFSNLIGYLKEFYKKMGYRGVRIKPAHFPYTEPSAQVDVLHPTMNKWIELGGAGMFRPEVVKPLLGKAVPVLAWGNGLERILAAYYGIKDIRDVYTNDLKILRNVKEWSMI